MVARNYAIAGALATAVFATFVILAQSHVALIPYLTPTVLEVQGLKDAYNVEDRATFDVIVKGYGSNCHMLQVAATSQSGDRVSYYKRADDCRVMTIIHGPYNFTRSFEYGNQVFAKQGAYKLDAQFEDLIDGNKASITKSITVNAR